VRARFISGDYNIQKAFDKTRQQILSQDRDSIILKQDINTMRQKMRKQFESQSSQVFNLKQAEGGVIDIEFIAQYVALTHSSQENRPTNTVQCLQLGQQSQLFSNVELKQLIHHYRAFRDQLNQSLLLDQDHIDLASKFKREREEVLSIWNQLFTTE
jgi:glutamate-ammonia-ligase adenylyltransferase